jgi:hypothetical protein
MSRTTLALILALMLSTQTAQSANMRMCTDEDGHKTFTQGACPKNSSRKSIEVQPAQSPVTAVTAGEKAMLSNAKNRRKTTTNQPQKRKTKKQKKRTIRRRCGG